MKNFEFKNELYLMPAHTMPSKPTYMAPAEDSITLQINYTTDPEAVQPYLPKGFTATDPAIVNVCFRQFCEPFNAHKPYNVVTFDISAKFEGEVDKEEGIFMFAIWENDFMPIICGREIMGVPKLMAEIPDLRKIGNTYKFSLSEYGTKMIEAEAKNFQKLSDEEMKIECDKMNSGAGMAYKYIPACNGQGADLSYPILLPSTMELKEIWRTTDCKIKIHDVTWEQCPLSQRLIDTLKSFPILEYQDAIYFRYGFERLMADQRKLK